MTNRSRFYAIFWLLLAGIIGSPETCNANAPVTLKGQTEVKRMAVRLSDIFDGVPAEIDRDVAQAPAPGKQVSYDINTLTRVAEKYRLDWQPQTLADHAVITTACTHISNDSIRDAIIRKIKETVVNASQKNSEVEVTFDNHALDVSLPADQSPDFALNNFDYDEQTKHFHTDLVASTTGGPFSVPLTGHISVKRSIPVLARRLESGATISASDIDWTAIPSERVNASIITDASQLIGRELRHDTDGGEVIRAHDIIPPRFVTRGSLITMKIETPFMSVSAQGKALQDGAEGDVIRVMNTQSNRMVEGTVTGAGVVTIHSTSQKLAAAQ
jgi:flagella basal body P-ring formation protein FlgA